jgi:hypothetical protein
MHVPFCQMCAPIEELVCQIEGCWRAVLPEDQFKHYPLDKVGGTGASTELHSS